MFIVNVLFVTVVGAFCHTALKRRDNKDLLLAFLCFTALVTGAQFGVIVGGIVFVVTCVLSDKIVKATAWLCNKLASFVDNKPQEATTT